MASVLVYTNGKSNRIVKRNNIVFVAHGPTGPAGKDAEESIVSGDLSGTLPSPAVIGLQGRSVADVAPIDQQFLGWEAAGSRWMPVSITIDIINGLKDALDGKEDTLTFDLVPTAGSTNPVESSGIFDAIQAVKSDIDLQRSVTKEPTGFFEPKNIIVTYDSTARTITLNGTVQGYWRGVQIPALVSGWVSPAHTTGDGVFYLYYNGTEFVWSTILWEYSYLHIARVVIENSGAIKIAFRECHGFQTAPSHHNDHQNIGTWRTDGTGLIPDSSYALDSTSPTDRRPDINLCELHDEDLRSSLPALTSKLYSWWYQLGTDIIFDTDHSEIISTSDDQPYWNENVSGVWQWTLFPNNHYGKIFIAAIPVTADANSQKYRYAFVPPQGTSNTLTGAKAFNTLSLDLGGIVDEIKEIVFIAEIIIQYTTSGWLIKEINEIVGSRATQITVSGSAAGQIASAIAAHAEETATHGVGEIVGTTESQELTGKTLDSYTNFIGADHVHIRAKALENILTGQPVYVTGYNSGENTQEIILANNAVAPANGIAAQDLTIGEFGFFIPVGVVSGFDTTAWNEGDILYVDGTGVLVNVEPLTGWQQPIAEVLRSNINNGAIQVSVGYPKQDSSDVRHTPGVSVADKFSQIDDDINALEQAIVLKGTWDASAGSFPGSGAAQAGWSYIINIGGTVDSVEFVANDRIVAIVDDASSTTYAGNWHKLDYTDQVLSVFGRTGAVSPQDNDYTADQITETETREFISPINNAKISDILQATIDLLQDPNAQLGSLHTDGNPIFDGIVAGRSAYPPFAFLATGGETVDDGKVDIYLKAQNSSTDYGGTIIIGVGSGPLGSGIISLEGEVHAGIVSIGAPVIAGVDLSGGVDTATVSGATDKLCSSSAVLNSINSLANAIDPYDQYVLHTGRAGGTVVYGSPDSGDDITLHSNQAKDGLLRLGDNSAYNEDNDSLGIGTDSPDQKIHILENGGGAIVLEDPSVTISTWTKKFILEQSGVNSNLYLRAELANGTKEDRTWWTSGPDAMYVGIDSNSFISFSHNSTNATIATRRLGTTTGSLSFSGYGSNGYSVLTATKISLNTNDGIILNAQDSNIGIGTTLQTARLHIKGSTSDSLAFIDKKEDSSGNIVASTRCDGQLYQSGPFVSGHREITDDETLTNSTTNRVLILNPSTTGKVVTGPSEPENWETIFYNISIYDVTFARNGKEIDGSVSNLTIPAGGVAHIKYFGDTIQYRTRE